MAFHRTHLYTDLKRKAAHFSRAFGHPERLEILLFLKENRHSTVSEIVKRSPLSLPTVSQHLKYLRETGLVEFYEDYPFTLYSLNENEFRKGIRMLVRVWSEINAAGISRSDISQ